MKSSSAKTQKALVMIPVFNEAKHLAHVLKAIPRKVMDIQIDLLVIDDGSTDTSGDIARKHRCLLIRHPKRRGYGAAIISGFSYATKQKYDFIVKLDGDRQHDPRYVATIIKILRRGGVDCVLSSRYLRKIDQITPPPFERKLVNFMTTGAFNRLTGRNLTDTHCGIFGLTSKLCQSLKLKTEGYGVHLEMILKIHFSGASLLEIPHPLIYGKDTSKFSIVYKTNNHLTERLGHYTSVMLDTLRELNISSSS